MLFEMNRAKDSQHSWPPEVITSQVVHSVRPLRENSRQVEHEVILTQLPTTATLPGRGPCWGQAFGAATF